MRYLFLRCVDSYDSQVCKTHLRFRYTLHYTFPKFELEVSVPGPHCREIKNVKINRRFRFKRPSRQPNQKLTSRARLSTMSALSLGLRSALRLQRGILTGVRCIPWRALSDMPEHKILSMPKLSPTMETGTIQEWVKAEGDRIEAGDTLAEIETDKATMSYEYNDEGYLAKVWLEAGATDVPIGTPMGVVVEEEDDIAAFADFQPPQAESKSPAPASEPAESPNGPTTPAKPATTGAPPVTSGAKIIASPLARTQAAKAGLSLADVTGTGPHGAIVAADVQEAIEAGPAKAPSSPVSVAGLPSYEDVPLTQHRRVTAERLTFSKMTIPHYYVVEVCNVDELMAVRARINKKADGEYKISVNDFVIKACAAALRTVPEVNSSWQENSIRQYSSADISVAVQAKSGLITPIVKNADRKGLKAISADVKTLVAAANEGTLVPEQFVGGTFTVSNLGMFGTEQFNAIINPPQAAILAVGAAKKVVVPADNEKGYEYKTQMKVTLSCDHRVIDGAVAAQWLIAFKRCMEDPLELIM